MARESGNEKLLEQTVTTLIETEKDQSTVELQRERIATEQENIVVDKLVDLIKNKF